VPIPIKQFEDATKPLPERIIGFLKEHPGQAYSLMEVMAGLEGHADVQAVGMLLMMEGLGGKGSETWKRYTEAMSELVRKGQVREAQLQGLTYYAYAGEVR
jgi:hypothetical protein